MMGEGERNFVAALERVARAFRRDDERREVGYGRLLFVLGVIWGVIAVLLIQAWVTWLT